LDPTDLSQFVRNADRFREVVTILAKHGLADWLSSAPAWLSRLIRVGQHTDHQTTTEQRLRIAMTELGTTFIKLGQVLSTRADLVGQELADELGQLRTDAPADPPEIVQALIETELGAPLAELFREFDCQPLASASIGQVHRAILLSGERVVVKVQHQGIEKRIVNDLEIIQFLAQMAERYAPHLRQYRPVQTAAEFKRTLWQELDFNRERINAERFRDNFASNPQVRFPRPFAERSSRRVLTMERFEGISVADRAGLQSAGVDLKAIARRGAEVFLDMIFRDGFYHADPHPGNLLILTDGDRDANPTSDSTPRFGVIGILDCGMVGRISDALRQDLEITLIAAANQNAKEISDVVVKLGEVPSDLDEEGLLNAIQDFIDDYGNQTLADFDLSGCLNGIIEVIRAHKIILNSKIAMLLKVFIMLEGTSQLLNPQFSLADLIQPYAVQSLSRRFSPQRVLRRIRSTYQDWDRLLQVAPRDLADILHGMKRGKFYVHVEHRRLETIVNRLVVGILTAALFVGSAALWSNQVPPRLFNSSIPGVIGAFTATFMGWQLLRQMRRTR